MKFASPCICGSSDVGPVIQQGCSHRGEIVDVRSCASCGLGRTYNAANAEDLKATAYQDDANFSDHIRHFARFRRYSQEVLRHAQRHVGPHNHGNQPHLLTLAVA